MTYGIVTVINGTHNIHAEGMTNFNTAKVIFHDLCQILLNVPDVLTAEVAIVEKKLDVVDCYKKFISHESTAAPVVEEETGK